MQNNQVQLKEKDNRSFNPTGKKILFANFPADGHFNPLTGLAKHLQSLGHDVRWYTSSTYEKKLKKLNIPFYPFKKAMEVKDNDFDAAFPERANHKSQIAKVKFDIINAFINRGPEYYTDILDVYSKFSFDMMVADVAFSGIPFVKELMKVPVISIGIFPLSETSKDLPPTGLGIEPSFSVAGRIKGYLLRKICNTLIFRQPNKVMHRLFSDYNIPHNGESLFNVMIKKSDLVLQSGTPGFEYYRSDMSRNIHFIGPLLPYDASEGTEQWFDERLNKFEKIVLVTQGTVEKDIKKILIPTLEAFKNTDTLVVATTGGNDTAVLKAAYPDRNFIIEDFIPFNDVMPYADVYVTNGGYGGVLLAIENRLPMVVAGVHEGKNEINARINYFELGINLKTETPKPEKLRAAVEEVFNDNMYKHNVDRLAKEFSMYDPKGLFTKYVNQLLHPGTAKIRTAIQQMSGITDN